MKSRDIVCSVPGGWHGNNPGSFDSDPLLGNVVIDPAEISSAIMWLRRRVEILETAIVGDGIGVTYRMKTITTKGR